MKIKNNKITLLSLLLILVLLFSIGYGCNKDDSADGDKTPSGETQLTLQLSDSSKTLRISDTYQIVATANTDGVITWSSDNEAAATVSDDGLVTAIAVGEAAIQAKLEVDNESTVKKCFITVLAENREPVIRVENVDENDSLILGKNDVYQLQSSLYFDGREIDGTIEYVSSDQTVATVSQTGEIQAQDKTGAVEITVKGTYREFTAETLNYTIYLNVIENNTLILKLDSDETLYGLPSYGGNLYKNSVGYTAKLVTDNGDVTTGISIVSKNEDVAEINGDQIIAKSVGTAEIEATIDYEGAIYTKTVTVTVDGRIEIDNTSNNVLFERKKEQASLTTFEKFTNDTEVQGVYYLNADGSVKNEVSTVGGKFENLAAGDGTVLILSSVFQVRQSLHVVDYMVTDTASLTAAFADLDGSYIELGADIDCKGVTAKRGSNNASNMTFDGKGHVLSNLTCEGRSLFGQDLSGCTIKNVSFVKLTNNGTQALLAQTAGGGTVFENVFVSGTNSNKDREVSLLVTDYAGVKFTNCIFSVYRDGENFLGWVSSIRRTGVAVNSTLNNVLFNDGNLLTTYAGGLPVGFGGDFAIDTNGNLTFNGKVVLQKA